MALWTVPDTLEKLFLLSTIRLLYMSIESECIFFGIGVQMVRFDVKDGIV